MVWITGESPELQKVGPVIEVQVGVSEAQQTALKKTGRPIPPPVPARAMLDTSAERSALGPAIATQLKLGQVSQISIYTPGSPNNQQRPVYPVCLFFPMMKAQIETTVIGAELEGQNIECLIGRNILRYGSLIYNGKSNIWSFRFEPPTLNIPEDLYQAIINWAKTERIAVEDTLHALLERQFRS